MKADDYTPVHLDGNIYTFAIELSPCSSCGALMNNDRLSNLLSDQAKKVGIRRHFDYWVIDGKPLCGECWVKYTNEQFECDLCGKRYPKADIKYKFNERITAYLCVHCYGTVTAEAWDQAKEDIHQKYRWRE